MSTTDEREYAYTTRPMYLDGGPIFPPDNETGWKLHTTRIFEVDGEYLLLAVWEA